MKNLKYKFKFFAVTVITSIVLFDFLTQQVECLDSSKRNEEESLKSLDQELVTNLKSPIRKSKQNALLRKILNFGSKKRYEQDSFDRRRHQAAKWDIGFGKRSYRQEYVTPFKARHMSILNSSDFYLR
jgi:hypothetical protein